MLKIWGRPTSTNTQRVLWTLVEAEVSYELTLASATTGAAGYVWRGHAPFGVIDTEAYRAMNPNRTIPTIDDDGFVLWESNAIVAWIARRATVSQLELMEAHLARSSWFAGDAFSIGDIPPGISIQRFFHFDLERPAVPRVEDWMARLAERDGFRRHVAPREKHLL